jgi:hypothetical protein
VLWAGPCELHALATPVPGRCLSPAIAHLIKARAPGSASAGGWRKACDSQNEMKCRKQILLKHYAWLRKCYASIRSHYAIPLRINTQLLRNSFTHQYAVVTQFLYASIRSCYAIPLRINTQLLRNSYTHQYAVHTQFTYAAIRNSICNSIRNSNTQFQYAIPIRINTQARIGSRYAEIHLPYAMGNLLMLLG